MRIEPHIHASCVLLAGILIAVGWVGVSVTAVALTPPDWTARAAPSVQHHSHEPCLDEIFYGPLPGKSDYCLGMHKWHGGDYRGGIALLKLAAGWGNKDAQYTLGLIYYNGRHVTADPALGAAWLKLADQRHNDTQIEKVTRAALRWATPAQRKHAEQLYLHMLPKYGDKVAAVRAWKHWRHWQERHGRGSAGNVCLTGAELTEAMHDGLTGTSPASARVRAALIKAGGSQYYWRCFVRVTVRTRKHVTRKAADSYFRGWIGTVNVGPLSTVPATPASSAH